MGVYPPAMAAPQLSVRQACVASAYKVLHEFSTFSAHEQNSVNTPTARAEACMRHLELNLRGASIIGKTDVLCQPSVSWYADKVVTYNVPLDDATLLDLLVKKP